ncbi:AraC family transcriptional regulator [Roseibacterium beibuensis]|uniref:helix-turn-helix domain-containing protein n=1 Tax=[Roseibacterium] beibuensis TaxID=1193142 RepID=UPI00217DFDDA|nr:AraC family transcriptional regulator [Roseibacterium beibuensis]MCS6625504.1 AraC family transcriptional regulator [Roseibacterium beibuensis]
MVLSVTLEASPGRRLVLSHYAPGEECRPHRHDWAQVSLLLAGGYVEDSDQGRARADGPGLSAKPGRFEHENRFGDAGALILSLNLETIAPERYFVARPAAAGRDTLKRMADGETGMTILAGTLPGEPSGPVAPPGPWLDRAHDRLLAEPDLSIAALSRSFGLHPVRFARLFREAFAQSPTAARQNRRSARAVVRIVRSGTPLAEVAADEGFADQAHLSRAVSQATGWSPGRLRRLFAAV